MGFFYKMNQAHIFVVITNLQFEKGEGWQRRHKILGPHGDIWLTVPIKGSKMVNIKDVEIFNGKNWRNRHAQTLRMAYRHTREREFLKQLVSIYEKKWDKLYDLNFTIIKFMKDFLEIPTKLVLDDEVCGRKQKLFINMCKKYGASTFLSGMGAKDYMTEEFILDMKRNKVGHEFVKRNVTAGYPYCAAHYILTEGKDWVKEIIKKDAAEKFSQPALGTLPRSV
jgi:hypothetical protein